MHISFSTGLRPGPSGVQIPAEAGDFSPKRPNQLWGPPSPLFSAYRGSFPGVKRPEREGDHLPPSNAEVQREWSYTSAPPIRLCGVDRDYFAFTFFFFLERCDMNLIVCGKPKMSHIKLQSYKYGRGVGFHFLPYFVSVFALSAISAPHTSFTESSSVGRRARFWESC